MFVSGNTDVYATPPTFDLSQLLIEDMLKITKDAQPFGLPELNNMMRNSKEIDFKQKITKGNATFELRETGHVIGGSSVLVESEKKRLFYTGDIKTHDSRMLREADLDIGDIDLDGQTDNHRDHARSRQQAGQFLVEDETDDGENSQQVNRERRKAPQQRRHDLAGAHLQRIPDKASQGGAEQ